MATYADVTTGVVHINNPGSSGTIYTVPANSRAKIRIQYLNNTGGVTLIVGHFDIATTRFPGTSAVTAEEVYLSNEIWLFAGDTITSSGTNYFLYAVIEEYSNP